MVRLLPRPLFQGLAIAGLAVGGLFAAALGGTARGPVAVVFPPWWGAIRAVEAAAEGGSVLRLGPVDFVVFVAPDEARGRERLWRAGAWLLLDPHRLIGCGSIVGRTQE